MTIIAFNTGTNPVHTGVYIVDRGEKLGTPLRWFNAETQFWSRCEYTIEDILNAKEKVSTLGFLPWRGPIKVVKPEATVPPVELVGASEVAKRVIQQSMKSAAKVKAPKAPKAPKVAKAPKAPKVAKAPKSKIPDGTIFFREDRQKYVAMLNGKQEAARPTIEACRAFLIKKGFDAAKIVVHTPAFEVVA